MPMASMPGASGGMPMMGGQQMGGMPMMGMMQVMMRGMAGHIEGRIAFLKAELKITDAQMSCSGANRSSCPRLWENA
jgi:hypothetical protein